MVKKIIVVITLLMIFGITPLYSEWQWKDVCSSVIDSSKSNYMCYRFRNISNVEGQHLIDMKQVEAVILDRHGQIWKAYGQTFCASQCFDDWWIFMKNGTKIYFGPSDVPKKAWEGYLDFLSNNPEYLSFPY